MKYNTSDTQALFWYSVLIIWEMASLNTLLICSAGQQPWICSWVVSFKFFAKTKAFVLIKLFLYIKKSVFSIGPNLSHCVKRARIRSFCGPYFSAFGLNAGKYGPGKLRKRTLFTQGACSTLRLDVASWSLKWIVYFFQILLL